MPRGRRRAISVSRCMPHSSLLRRVAPKLPLQPKTNGWVTPARSGRALRRPGKAGIKCFSASCQIGEDLRRREARAIFLLKLFAQRNEVAQAHPVDVTQCAPGKWGETKA